MHAFCLALTRSHVIDWNSDWFIALFASAVIGRVFALILVLLTALYRKALCLATLSPCLVMIL